MKLIEAIAYIKNKHSGQIRKQGTPYYLHPVEVANILKKKGFSKKYQLVGLFHDLLEDTDTTYEDINRISNNDLAKMVKLADRLHNLSETHLASLDFKKRYIKESEAWFIDLAKGTIFEDDLKNILEKLKQEI